MIATFEEVVKVEVPKVTRTYVPVANKDLILGLREQLRLADLNIVKESYELGGTEMQFFGTMVVEPEGTEKEAEVMKRVVGFRNSYNKTLPIGLVAGASIVVCSNLMFSGEILRLRKHTVNVYRDLDNLMYDVVLILERKFNKIQEESLKLMEVQVSRKLAAEICGKMFMEEDIITSTQLLIIKRKWLEAEKDSQSGWDLMNHVTYALKTSPPRTRMESQLSINDYLVEHLLT